MIEQIRTAFIEWIRTFSNTPSLLSSKRIERFLAFTCMLVPSVYYLIKGIYNWEIDSTNLMVVVAGWLGYGGFNTVQSRKDKQQEDGNQSNKEA